MALQRRNPLFFRCEINGMINSDLKNGAEYFRNNHFMLSLLVLPNLPFSQLFILCYMSWGELQGITLSPQNSVLPGFPDSEDTLTKRMESACSVHWGLL
jgi:hypothetical protein